MSTRKAMRIVGVTAAAIGIAGAAASPAMAGGVGDFLSPAFGTTCMNKHDAHSRGSTTHGTGISNGNLAGLPIGSPANQCGGADLLPKRPDDLAHLAKEKFGEATSDVM
ncbi:chaplin family protein [Streptomyces sp. NPDC006339]|uniref:chaplin family protein n=1 Tax=Streptomyces sp. NPDC006339 TaxID=3156755 RepID=UPI0033A96AF3